jgi:hypothetical protein
MIMTKYYVFNQTSPEYTILYSENSVTEFWIAQCVSTSDLTNDRLIITNLIGITDTPRVGFWNSATKITSSTLVVVSDAGWGRGVSISRAAGPAANDLSTCKVPFHKTGQRDTIVWQVLALRWCICLRDLENEKRKHLSNSMRQSTS